jgi:hypothetical protein
MKVHLSKETYSLVQAVGLRPPDQCKQHEDGSWTVPLQEETVAKLQRRSLKGETLSDTIFRILMFAATHAN